MRACSLQVVALELGHALRRQLSQKFTRGRRRGRRGYVRWSLRNRGANPQRRELVHGAAWTRSYRCH